MNATKLRQRGVLCKGAFSILLWDLHGLRGGRSFGLLGAPATEGGQGCYDGGEDEEDPGREECVSMIV